MMAAEATSLIDRLPKVRGELVAGAALAPLTWFRVGGVAEVLFRPADADDLADFLAGTPEDVPVTVIGVGSNLLVRGGGVKGVVIRLGRPFMNIEVAEGACVRAGTAALDVAVSRAAQEAGLAGLEFYRGIPGSIGGALRMNGGAYGRETKDVLVEAVAIDRKGKRHVLSNADMHYSYRHCGAPEDLIFVEALFQAAPGNAEEILRRMNEITASREATQPIRTRTGGSTFKNPEGQKSWQLIDAAGCRGLRRGGAQVSELHCNFLINTGDATASDLEELGEEVRARVKETSGITLEWEIRRIGMREGEGA
ncbi:MAG: UDP-N-acetylmuramate dehydrogenase [Parvibaculum sp.]|uniref:UDP-N-acetylmuramate dehydrogenase n=1 Tax=Parvibaculum sp. TaxID=2024848 RepID=UPI003299D6B2